MKKNITLMNTFPTLLECNTKQDSHKEVRVSSTDGISDVSCSFLHCGGQRGHDKRLEFLDGEVRSRAVFAVFLNSG